MGQAKLRGSYEQRKLEGEVKRAEAEQQRQEEMAAAEAAITPEQRKDRQRFRSMLAMVLGVGSLNDFSKGKP